MVSTRVTSRGNHRSLVRACDSLCGTVCSCNFPESQHKVGPFALSIGEKHSVRCKVYGALYALSIWAQWKDKLFFLFARCVYDV